MSELSDREEPDNGSEVDTGAPIDESQAEPKKQAIPRRPKLDAERILDTPNGIERLVRDFPEISFSDKSNPLMNLDLLMTKLTVWASELYPYGLNLQDFARATETALQHDTKRRKIYELRARYLKEQGVFGATDEDLAAARCEANRLKALERRRQKEQGAN